jgi:hypothetical protein
LNMRVSLYILVWVILLQTGDLTIDIYGENRFFFVI